MLKTLLPLPLALALCAGVPAAGAGGYGDDQRRYHRHYDDRGYYDPAPRFSRLSLLRRLAESGHRDAQYRLGKRYARGVGVTQDYRRAYVWFSLAAAQGHRHARYARDDVARYLGPRQLARAQRRAARFAERYAGGRGGRDDGYYRRDADREFFGTVPAPRDAGRGRYRGDHRIAEPAPYADRRAGRDDSGLVLDTETIRLVQTSLRRLGYRPGPSDGRLGPRTRAAIRAYRQRHDLGDGGRPTLALLEHLSVTLERYDGARGDALAFDDEDARYRADARRFD